MQVQIDQAIFYIVNEQSECENLLLWVSLISQLLVYFIYIFISKVSKIDIISCDFENMLNSFLSLSLSLLINYFPRLYFAGQSQSRRRRGYAGSYASSGAGAGGGYTGSYTGGYNGGYNDYDDYGDGGHYVSNFGITDPYLFHQQLTNQILAQNYANQQWATDIMIHAY